MRDDLRHRQHDVAQDLGEPDDAEELRGRRPSAAVARRRRVGEFARRQVRRRRSR